MSYRYSNTDKWDDAWFVKLKPLEKLLFNFLCDNCDIAGFIEINSKTWATIIGINCKQIEGALKGLQRGLIFADDCIYIKNFLKHQKNLPLNENNKAHLGIIRRFELYKHKFNFNDYKEFVERGFEGASKGLASPTGNGIDNGIGKEEREELLKKREEKFRNDVYLFTNDPYPLVMLQKFCDYWTELNKSKTKMRYELEKTWETSRRLATWASRDNTFNKKTGAKDPVMSTKYIKHDTIR